MNWSNRCGQRRRRRCCRCQGRPIVVDGVSRLLVRLLGFGVAVPPFGALLDLEPAGLCPRRAGRPSRVWTRREGVTVVQQMDPVRAIGTLVERTTGFVLLLHLPGDHTAATVADAMTAATARLAEKSASVAQRGTRAARWLFTPRSRLPFESIDSQSGWVPPSALRSRFRWCVPSGLTVARPSGIDAVHQTSLHERIFFPSGDHTGSDTRLVSLGVGDCRPVGSRQSPPGHSRRRGEASKTRCRPSGDQSASPAPIAKGAACRSDDS